MAPLSESRWAACNHTTTPGWCHSQATALTGGSMQDYASTLRPSDYFEALSLYTRIGATRLLKGVLRRVNAHQEHRHCDSDALLVLAMQVVSWQHSLSL